MGERRQLLFAVAAALVVLGLSRPAPAAGQTRHNGRLLVTVSDQSGAVLPGATVTVIGLDATTRSAGVAPVKTSDQGVAAITGLAPGRYAIHAEFPGFQARTIGDARVLAGDNPQHIVLEIERLQTEITVGRDAQSAAADPRGAAFGSSLTREQIDALSDNPEEMQHQLADLAGVGAVIRVDRFESPELPPKAQIKSIHVTRDAFAAENHNAGTIFIDIITQPGTGPLRGGGRFNLRDGALSAGNPFTPTRGPERTQNFGMNVGGSLVPQKSSFSISVDGATSFETPNLNVALPGGVRSEALILRTPRDRVNLAVQFDQAIRRDRTLRVAFYQSRATAGNLGVGAFELPEHAYSTKDTSQAFRIQEAGPLGRRLFTNTRLNVGWTHSEQHSALEAPTVRVLDAFTSGGAQVLGGRNSKVINLASDLDYIRGVHTVRAGIAIDAGWWSSDLTSNYLGTYTFESLAAYEAGRPRSFTRRIGDPAIEYTDARGGIYVQDDIRVRRSLTLSPGLRYELQTHVRGTGSVGPRLAATWAPFKSGRTTLRASTGVFYDWLDQNTYEQTLRVDGTRQREIDVVDPTYPNPGTAGSVPPVNRYLLGDRWQMPRNFRVTLAADQLVAPTVRLGVLYSHLQRERGGRGRNLNAPTDGVRPDPAFSNIIEVASDASARQHTVGASYQIGRVPPPFLSSKAPKVDWRRVFLIGQYTYGVWNTNTDGDFTPPPSGALATEWGPASNDARHRLFTTLIAQAMRNLQTQLNVNVASPLPYTIRTGYDDNGDLIFNDRPAGTGRNSVRADAQWTLNANISYAFQFGKRVGALPPGIRIINLNGTPQVDTMSPNEQPRFRLLVYVQAQNLTDRYNYAGYSGVITSPFFGAPTMVLNPRKIDTGLQFQF